MPMPQHGRALTRLYAAALHWDTRKITAREGKAFHTCGHPPYGVQFAIVSGVHPRCRVCREINDTPVALLYLFMAFAWTPFWPQRMRRFVFEHDFGCDERFATF